MLPMQGDPKDLTELFGTIFKDSLRDFPGGPVTKNPCSNAMGPGSISGWATRSHRLQVEILHATTKTRRSQINSIKIKSFKYWQNQYLKLYVLARGKTLEEVRSGVHSSRALLAGL